MTRSNHGNGTIIRAHRVGHQCMRLFAALHELPRVLQVSIQEGFQCWCGLIAMRRPDRRMFGRLVSQLPCYDFNRVIAKHDAIARRLFVSFLKPIPRPKRPEKVLLECVILESADRRIQLQNIRRWFASKTSPHATYLSLGDRRGKRYSLGLPLANTAGEYVRQRHGFEKPLCGERQC